MIEFIYGMSRPNKINIIIDKMQSAIAAEQKIILIAPEQQALMWDTLCAKRLPATAAFKIETVSFTRLADSIFRKYGGCAKSYINDTQKSLLMWSAVSSVKDKLLVYNKGREDRYIPLLLSAVSEAQLYRLTPESLINISELLLAEGKSEGLARRLHDLSLVWAAYDSLLHSAYDDPEEIPDALCELLDRHSCFSGCCVFIDSFYTLTPKEKNIVRRIFMQADNAYVSISLLPHDRDSIHTAHIRAFKNELAESAARSGHEVKIVDAGDADKPLEIRYLINNLWEHSAPPYKEECAHVKIYCCGDRHDEAAVCAARILELVRGGARYSDIAVVAADMEALRGICDVQLAHMGIPVYMSLKSELINKSAVRLLLAAASVAAGGWRREDVIAVAKTGLSPLTPKESDALEKYTEKWRLRGKKAFVCDGWSMNPDGYTEQISEWGYELLTLANNAREKLVPPLDDFCSAISGSTAAACAQAAFKLLLDFNVYEKLQKKAEAEKRSGKISQALETEQVWEVICSLLDTLVSFCGNEKIDAARFAGLLRRCAQSSEIGTIPDTVDRVILASASSARLDGISHIIILGAVEGEFPAVPGDNGFFCEHDKSVLAPLGVSLSPGIDMRRSEELFRFYFAATAASDTLSLIIPSRDEASGTKRPSTGMLRIMKLLPQADVMSLAHENYKFLLQNRESALYLLPYLRKTAIYLPLSQLLCEAPPPHSSLCAYDDYVTHETASELFGDSMKLTQSRLECFADCAFSYYCKYILKLDDGEAAQISPSHVGNFVHKILENFLSEVNEKDLTYPLDENYVKERSAQMVTDYIKAVAGELSGKRLDYLFAKISRSLRLYIRSISDEFAQSQFRPWGFEVPVGFDEKLPPLNIELGEGATLSMRGIVDRIDVYRQNETVYVRVADYKTGAKDFKLDEVLGGRNVQLLLYLFSVCGCPPCETRKKLAPGGERILPAGAVYFSARPGEAAADNPLDGDAARELTLSSISRKGIILRDEAIIRAMEPDGEGKYIPVKFKNDGTLYKSSVCADINEMDEIRTTLCNALKNTGIDMKTGRASAMPSLHGNKLPCDYCKMRPVCRYDKKGEEAENR